MSQVQSLLGPPTLRKSRGVSNKGSLMFINRPSQKLTLYFKSGNVVTVPLHNDAIVEWKNRDGRIVFLSVEGIKPPLIGAGFSIAEVEAITVEQV